MNIYCVGNVLLKNDNLPLRFMDVLRSKFPKHTFLEADPNENFIPEEGAVIIDTVVGATEVKLYTSPDDFTPAPHVSAHDYDLSFHLRFLQKVGKLQSVRIIGIPQSMDEGKALTGVSHLLKKLE